MSRLPSAMMKIMTFVPAVRYISGYRCGRICRNPRIPKASSSLGTAPRSGKLSRVSMVLIEDFAVQDWRHHWASHCVMAGVAPPADPIQRAELDKFRQIAGCCAAARAARSRA